MSSDFFLFILVRLARQLREVIVPKRLKQTTPQDIRRSLTRVSNMVLNESANDNQQRLSRHIVNPPAYAHKLHGISRVKACRVRGVIIGKTAHYRRFLLVICHAAISLLSSSRSVILVLVYVTAYLPDYMRRRSRFCITYRRYFRKKADFSTVTCVCFPFNILNWKRKSAAYPPPSIPVSHRRECCDG